MVLLLYEREDYYFSYLNLSELLACGCVGGAATTRRWYGEDIVVTSMAVAWSRSLGLRKLIYYHRPGANTSIFVR